MPEISFCTSVLFHSTMELKLNLRFLVRYFLWMEMQFTLALIYIKFVWFIHISNYTYCSGKKHGKGIKHAHFCSYIFRARKHKSEKLLLLVHLRKWEQILNKLNTQISILKCFTLYKILKMIVFSSII